MNAREAKKLAELYVTAVVQRLLPREPDQPRQVEPDPVRTARIRKYLALSMRERYGDHGP